MLQAFCAADAIVKQDRFEMKSVGGHIARPCRCMQDSVLDLAAGDSLKTVQQVIHGSVPRRFLERCGVFALAESLGGVESLVDHPGIMTHASVPEAERAALGISDQLIRLSVGIEAIADLIADLEQALS